MPGTVHFPDIGDYIRAASCGRCKVTSGDPCVMKRKGDRRGAHSNRAARGISWYNRDVVKAPWREDREDRCYCSIPGHHSQEG